MNMDHIIYLLQHRSIHFDKIIHDYTVQENMETTVNLTKLISDRFHLNLTSEKNLHKIIEDALARGADIHVLAPAIYDIMEIFECEKADLIERMSNALGG